MSEMAARGGRVLVTGANGHLGRRLLARLAGRGETRALVRSERAADTLRALPEPPEIVVASWQQAPDIARAAADCAGVVHLVGILKETAAARYADAHEGTAEVLAKAAREAGVARIVHPSILGASPDAPNACLASKGRAERILLESGVPTSVLQLPMVIGEGEIATAALRGMLRARLVPMVRGGASLEQPIDGEDVVAAILAALADRSRESQVYRLAGPESLTRRALLTRAAALLGRRPPRVLPVPLGAARAAARAAERWMAAPPLTPAMLGVLEHDDRIDPEPALRALGLKLTPLDETLRRVLAPELEA